MEAEAFLVAHLADAKSIEDVESMPPLAERGRMLSRSTHAAWAVLLLGAAGCAEAAPPAVTVADSAGVRITLSRDRATAFAHVSPDAALSLGGPDEAGPTQFFRIQNVHVDPRGRLWVADGQSGELRIFQPDGTPWKVRGGTGQGPGEFGYIRLLGARSGDSVFVADGADGRVAVYDPDGELARTMRVLSGEDPAPRLFSVFSDGSTLGQVPRIVMVTDVAPGQVLRDSVELVRVDAEGREWRPWGEALGPLWLWTGRSQVPVAFTTNAGFAVAGAGEVHLVSGPAFRIQVFEDGRLREVYGVERPPRPVGGAHVEAYRRQIVEHMPGDQQADYLSGLEHEARPTELPAWARVLVTAEGYVWAQRYEADPAVASVWDVFDQGRRLLGQVTTPPGLVVMRITASEVVGVWRDEVGVEYVRSYAVHD